MSVFIPGHPGMTCTAVLLGLAQLGRGAMKSGK